MNDKILEELRYYFNGYGSRHDETILKLIDQNKRYREAINRFFELDGNYKDIVNKAERIFAKVLDEALESETNE